MTRPAHDPQAELLPYNPAILGRLRAPPKDSKSLIDHLAPTRLDSGTHPLRGKRQPVEPKYHHETDTSLDSREWRDP